MVSLDDYRAITPPGTVDVLRRMSAKLQGRTLLQVHAQFGAGGSAELLRRITQILQELGIQARLDTISGDHNFEAACAELYNALQEQEIHDARRPRRLGADMLERYVETNRSAARDLDLAQDFVIVHDHPPAPLVEFRPQEGGHWVWRCHLDLATPDREAWAFLRRSVTQFDAAVFSLSKFSHRVPIPQFLMYPSIDPYSERNRELEPSEINAVLERLKIPLDRPILLQVSPFHHLKDPLGVLRAYEIVRRRDDCQLVLAGVGAADGEVDAELEVMIRERAAELPDVHVVPLARGDDLEVNALQRAATIVVQKSIREGFGLMVAEAMWKGKPVIGGATGGITSQLVYDITGYTVHSPEGCAFRIRQLLNNPAQAEKMGEDAREFVRRHFLITRNIGDYLALMNTLLN